MNPFEIEMSKALQKLAMIIIPSDEHLKNSKVCTDNIIKLLQSKSKFDIDRACIAGSTGKKTTIINSDIDCVLFINAEWPRFNDVLDDIENILTMSNAFKIRDVHATKYSVQFKAMDYDFDILPATNFTYGLQLNGDNLIDVQQQRALAEIKRDPKKYGYMYSSSLAEAVTRFMKRQNGFVNEMVRIAKFWYKTLYFDEYVSGAKTFIELIAVYAANQEEEMQEKFHLRSFKRFIDYLRNFDNLNIHFERNKHQVSGGPCVMDPVNPYNNLAQNWDPKSIRLIKNYANETSQRLHSLTNAPPRLDQLFMPQPISDPDICEIFDLTKSQWMISFETFSGLPDLKVRNERFHTDGMLSTQLEILKKYFQFAIFVSLASGIKEYKINEVVQNTISKQIYGTNVPWVQTSKQHEDFDVTFTFPLWNQKAFRISYQP